MNYGSYEHMIMCTWYTQFINMYNVYNIVLEYQCIQQYNIRIITYYTLLVTLYRNHTDLLTLAEFCTHHTNELD
jgi:hypothetical protein